MVVPVVLPKTRGMSYYPAFHPKTWLLDYVNESGEHSYRFVVMSRNLTFDRSWDISIVLNSSKKVRQVRKTKPIIDFIEYLRGHIKNTTQLAGKKRSMMQSFMEELKKVSFSLESKEFEENFQILPMGIGEKSYKMWEDELLCDTKWSASSTFHDLVIMSPFLSDGMIESWNMHSIAINVEQETIFEISKLEHMEAITAGEEDSVTVYLLNKGKTSANNVTIELISDKLNGTQTVFAGNIVPGTESIQDIYFVVDEPGVFNGKVVVTYENTKGKQSTMEKEFSIEVMEAYYPEWDEPVIDEPVYEEEPAKTPWIAIGVAAVVVAVVVAVIITKKRKAKKNAEDEDEDI